MKTLKEMQIRILKQLQDMPIDGDIEDFIKKVCHDCYHSIYDDISSVIYSTEEEDILVRGRCDSYIRYKKVSSIEGVLLSLINVDERKDKIIDSIYGNK